MLDFPEFQNFPRVLLEHSYRFFRIWFNRACAINGNNGLFVNVEPGGGGLFANGKLTGKARKVCNTSLANCELGEDNQEEHSVLYILS